MTVTSSQFRCDECDEEFVVEIEAGMRLASGQTVPLPPGVDLVAPEIPCLVCSKPMRRLDPRLDRRL